MGAGAVVRLSPLLTFSPPAQRAVPSGGQCRVPGQFPSGPAEAAAAQP